MLSYTKGCNQLLLVAAKMSYSVRILVLEEVLNSLVGNHLLVKAVRTALRILHHLDNLCVRTAISLAGTQGSHYFLCHSIFLVYGCVIT